MDADKPASAQQFHSDRPIKEGVEDRLGFREIARNLAAAVISQSAADGLVIGITGRWGTGKSSLMNLLTEEIQNSTDGATIVPFEPWLVGERDVMVASLISDLARAVDKLENARSPAKKAAKGTVSIAETLRGYGVRLGRGVSPVIKAAGALGVPWAESIAKAVDAGAEALSGLEHKEQSLSDLKTTLTAALRDFYQTFVVIIDDLDRLEPAEVAEVIRLVRAVGDFPNIIYLLCYDEEILAGSLEKALGVNDGRAYLQKIVQVTFALPKPEDFDLRRWLREECQSLYTAVTGKALSGEEEQRLAAVCDISGNRVETARDVNQVINALKLAFPPVQGQVDFPDLCYLQIIKVKSPLLYKWIEDYLSILSVVVDGSAHSNDEERAELGKRLMAVCPSDNVGTAGSIWTLKDYVPGLQPGAGKDQDRVLQSLAEGSIASLEAGRRLGSPHHFRLYFSFSKPSGSLADAEMRELLSVADRTDTLRLKLRALITEARPQGGTRYEVFLDRLARWPLKGLDDRVLAGLCMAIGNTVDIAVKAEPERVRSFSKQTWGRASKVLANVLNEMSTRSRSKRGDLVKVIFAESKSMGWLLADILRDEVRSHQRLKGQGSAYAEPILSADELDVAIDTMKSRLRTKAARRELVDTPGLLGSLYGWSEIADARAPKQWAKSLMRQDEEFVRIVEGMRGASMSLRGVFRPLNKSEITPFADYEGILGRLTRLSKKVDNPLREKAIELLEAAKQARR